MHKWVGVLVATILGLNLTVPFVSAAGSAAIVLDPAVETVSEGETFEINAIVRPNGEALDTVRLFLSFDPNLLQAEEVILGEMFERQSPGNLIDNDAGEISQGGFTLTGQKTDAGVFCTILFTAKASGNANIQVLDTSRLIHTGEEKINTGALLGATVTINESTPAGVGELSLISTTHPNEEAWYVGTNVSFEWQAPEGKTITRSFVAFDSTPDTNPTETTVSSAFTKEGVADGIWFFHLKGLLSDGSLTSTMHYRVQIDTTVPNPLVPTLDKDQITVGETTFLRFGTTDELSGVENYYISLSDTGYLLAASPYELKDLPEGTYFIEVKAVDRAGNSTYGSTAIRVYPEGVLAPVEEKGKRLPLLIISILGALALLGIISWLKKRRVNK